ncbi:MAG: M20 family metallopeptidase [Deltaproteobacteria bacterium]
MVNSQRLSTLIRTLIAIDSQNPPGNESAIARFVCSYLRKMGLEPRTVEYAKDRTNVLCRMAGGGPGTLLLTPHLDTVPAGKGWKRDPFNAVLEKGRLYGLGTTDCKGNLACTLEAMNSLIDERVRLRYDILFAATADEESGSVLGLEPLLKDGTLKPDAAVVLDVEDFHIIVAQKGLMHVRLRVKGKRAHGAYPWNGENAIDVMAAILCDLKKFRPAYRKNPYLREPTVNAGTIKGGDKINVVADWCEVELDLRFLPGMRPAALLSGLKTAARRHARKFEVEVLGVQQPYEIGEGHRLVTQMKKAMTSRGIRPMLKGSEGATVISFFQKAGIPSIATGFGTEGNCHVNDEYVKADNLFRGAGVIEEFLRTFSF